MDARSLNREFSVLVLACPLAIDFLLGSLISQLLVFLVCDHLKMILIDTQAVVTHVVDLFFPRNESVLVGEGNYVNSHSLSVKRHSWVATTTALTRMGASPDMTWTGYTIDLESHVDNRDVGRNLLPDVISPAHGLQLCDSNTLALERTDVATILGVDVSDKIHVPRI